jgi:hypothetical protein
MQTLFPGETKTLVTTQAGRVHFFLVRSSQRAKARLERLWEALPARS